MKKKLELKYIIFITTLLLSVTTLLTFWFICSEKFSDLITERVVDDYAEITVAVQKNVETLVSYTEDFAKYLSLDEQVQSLLEEYNAASSQERVQDKVTMYNKWEDISIQLIYSTTRLAGFGVYSGQELLYSFFYSAGEYDTDIISGESLQMATEQKQPFWTDLLTLNGANTWFSRETHVFSVLKYVQGSRGEYLGTLVLFVHESSFSDILANSDNNRNQQFYLVDKKGKIISAETKTCLYQNVQEVLGITEKQYETCLAEKRMLLESTGEAPILYMSSPIEGTDFRLIGRTVLEELQVQRFCSGYSQQRRCNRLCGIPGWQDSYAPYILMVQW